MTEPARSEWRAARAELHLPWHRTRWQQSPKGRLRAGWTALVTSRHPEGLFAPAAGPMPVFPAAGDLAQEDRRYLRLTKQ